MKTCAAKREIYIDVLRITACLLVIFNHTNERGFRLYGADELHSLRFVVDLFLAVMCKCAVPVFFMISGMMLISRTETIKETYRRIPRILVDLVLFQLLYFRTDALSSGAAYSLRDTALSLIQKNYWHLWYLYAYIAFLITLPIVRKLVTGLDIRISVYMLAVAVFVKGFIPVIEYIFLGGGSIHGSIKPTWLAADILIYPVSGYIAGTLINMKEISKKHMLALWSFNGVCFLISMLCEYRFLSGSPENWSNELFLSNFSIVNALVIFITARYLLSGRRIGAVTQLVITEIAKNTYGIYLLHIWILWKIPFLYRLWRSIESECIFGPMAGVWISCVGTFFIACIIVYDLRQIPLIRKLF